MKCCWAALAIAVFLAGCASTHPAAPPGPKPQPIAKLPHSATSPPSNKPQPQKFVDPRSQRCIALAMYWEARGEGRGGMLAVGSVVLNRVTDRRFPNTPCAVVYQGGETPPCQFSWWCDGKSDRPTHKGQWRTALSLAGELLAYRPRDPTDGALFFHASSVRTPWRRRETARIGNHTFYR